MFFLFWNNRVHLQKKHVFVCAFSQFLCPWNASFDRWFFIKTRCYVPVCIVPLVKAERADMRSVGAVVKDAQTIVAPWSCEIDAFRRYALTACEAAFMKAEAFCLGKGMGRSGRVADITHVIDRTDLAVFKQGVRAAEDEIHSSFDQTVFIYLTAELFLAQIVSQKAVITLDQVVRKRSGEQSVLG